MATAAAVSTSLSQAVFYLPPRGNALIAAPSSTASGPASKSRQQATKTSRGKRKAAAIDEDSSAATEANPASADPTEAERLRARAHAETWAAIADVVKALLDDADLNVFQEVCRFVEEDTTASGPILEVPTALLFAGFNVPDHTRMFQCLKQQLTSVTKFIAMLQSRDCSSTRNLILKLTEELLGVVENDEDQDVTALKASRFSMASLGCWYADEVRRSGDVRKPVVVILEDFELFNAEVVQDFVSVCSKVRSQLPIVLVFGIATSGEAVHQTLTYGPSRLLKTRKFRLMESNRRLNDLISTLFIGNGRTKDFAMGSRAFNQLVDAFLLRNFSVDGFVRGLRAACMDHFAVNPLSGVRFALADSGSLTPSLCDQIRQLKSFQDHVAACDDQAHANALATNNSVLITEVEKLFEKIDNWFPRYEIALKCCVAVIGLTPFRALGHKLREIHAHCLEGPLSATAEYPRLISVINFMAGADLENMLDTLITLSGTRLPEVNQEWDRLRNALKRILHPSSDNENAQDPEQEEEESEEMEDVEDVGSSLPHIPLKDAGVSVRRRQQLSVAHRLRANKPATKFEKLRMRIRDSVDKFFRTELLSLRQFPLHECILYDNASWLGRALDGKSHSAIITALSQPGKYIDGPSCAGDRDTVSSTMPDTSIAYKLHLESRRLINMFDWMEAFTEVIAPEAEQTAVLQARFVRAVAELQFLGFIKATKRKTDHVVRIGGFF